MRREAESGLMHLNTASFMRAPDTEQPATQSTEDRLGSWKAIAAFLKRDITTVQRWERREGMPVHRHQHDKRGSVYAFRSELDAWMKDRRPKAEPEPLKSHKRPMIFAAAALAVICLGLGAWWLVRTDTPPTNPFVDARISPLTDFEGVELAAAISRDGKFVAFLSDRDGPIDAWITQVGTGDFRNLTKGAAPELVNPEVRSLAFTPDGSLLTLWTRRANRQPAVNVQAIPTMGGALRDFRAGAVELDWSSDGRTLVFHTTDAGDPTFITEASASAPRQIHVAPKGQHNHFQTWSPDDRYIYFVRGIPPEETDLWRMKADGTEPERLTFHNSRVLYPTFIDARTLVYLATSEDGSGPWLYAFDLEQAKSRRVSFGVEQYSSIAATANGARLVATVEHSKASLWSVALTSAPAGENVPTRVSVPTVGAFSPRFAGSALIYVSAKNDGHAIWKFANETATELWSAPQTRVLGGPAISPDQLSIAFVAEHARGTRLHVLDLGGNARELASDLDIRGTPAWSPDGRSIIVAANRNGEPQLHRVPLDGSTPSVFVAHYSMNPLWSPDGKYLVYAEADAGPDFSLKAVDAMGAPHALPEIKLPRGARRVAFIPGQNVLVVMQGEMRHNNFWRIDLNTGDRRQLTNFGREFTTRDFDVSPDGTEMLFDRRQEDSDLALIELRRASE